MAEEKAKTTTITGTVTSANERGVRLDGGEEWYNLSKYGTDGVVMPAKGSHVTLTLDAKGFIKKVEAAALPEGQEATPQPTTAASPSSYALRDRTVCREWAVNAAVNVLGGVISVPDGFDVEWLDKVMLLADRLAAWALSGEPWTPAAPRATTGAPPPFRASVTTSEASPAIVGGPDESAPSGQRAYEAPPRQPAMPSIVAEKGDDEPATPQALRALTELRKASPIGPELLAAMARNWWGVEDGHNLTRGQVRTLVAWLGQTVKTAAKA